ncbi:MAG TPA: ATP-binding protein [Candidatus Limnocylindrales bacterium]|nr:ATP-binding protein [Candidatus Limnocylindrales bacterium]
MTGNDVDLLFEGLARLEDAVRSLVDVPTGQGDEQRPGSRFFAPSSQLDVAPDIDPALAIHAPTRLEWLADAYDLSPFDVDVVLVALAPELDRRFGSLYDRALGTAAGRPTVGLAIDLLCSSRDERLRGRSRFAPDAPLVGSDLLRLSSPTGGADGLLDRFLALDPQISRLLLAEDRPDDELAAIVAPVRASVAATAVFEPIAEAALTAFAAKAGAGSPLRLYLRGPSGSGKRRCAAVIAGQLELDLLAIDLRRRPAGGDLRIVLRRALREASFLGALPYLSRLDELSVEERLDVMGIIAAFRGSILLGGEADRRGLGPWPDGVTEVALGIQPVEDRRRAWAIGLGAVGVAVDDRTLSALAGRYRLTPGQIVSAIDEGGGIGGRPDERADDAGVFAQLRLAAASVGGFDLAPLAERLSPTATWDDIVLPDDAVRQLREICSRVDEVYHVLGEWGFGSRFSRGRGTSALFAGPSGTGKTMAAEIVATELGLDLYRIDLAGVVSKYIGETEKNLDRIFAAAEGANAILLFDEADALFGKRSEVRDAHDRYANIEISYLLAKMELFEGLTILATNLRQNLDEAFVRRLAFTIHFPFPNAASRAEIWRRVWPSAVPLAADVDLELLARDHRLSGGNIRNAAIAAAYLAAAEDSAVAMRHLRHAVRREYQKMGVAGLVAAAASGDAAAAEAQAVA